MDHLSNRRENPFGMRPPCARFVAGYGDPTADFHVIGDHPAAHGGLETGIPFTGMAWSERFFAALQDGGLVQRWADDWSAVDLAGTYLSYRFPCLPADGTPPPAAYDRLEPFFDAELRAITAHVLLPVGSATIRHVLGTYTALGEDAIERSVDPHAEEIRGAGWLVLPVRDPADWTDGDADALVEALEAVQSRDYRQTADLGRFRPGGDPYLVR